MPEIATISIILIIVGVILLLFELSTRRFYIAVPATVLLVLGVTPKFLPNMLNNWFAIIILILIVSIVSLLVTMKVYEKLAPREPPVYGTLGSFMGTVGYVIKTVEPDSISGKVKIHNREWAATAQKQIAVGRKVEVIGGKGVHMEVREVTERRASDKKTRRLKAQRSLEEKRWKEEQWLLAEKRKQMEREQRASFVNKDKPSPPPKTPIPTEPLATFSALNYEKASVVYKVKLENRAPYPISEVKVRPYFDEHLFTIDADEKTVGLLKRSEAKTVTFRLRPKGECGNTHLSGRVTYFDMQEEKHRELELKARETAVICPMLRRREIDEPQWQATIDELVSVKEDSEELPLAAKRLFESVCRVVQDMNLYRLSPQVTDEGQLFEGVARFYAEGVKGIAYGVQAEVIGGPHKAKLLLRAFAPNEAALIGFYHALLDEVEKRTKVKDYLAPVVYHVAGDYVAGSKTEVRDSVVSRSRIGGGEGD